ncbi:tRNA methyl transferase family protein [Babesia divergens]|uniref:tRNA-5-taurinomethyluridine 2-sulfurtransferase n=1 Tax=Babesia divergens TaxID=32595 RepID=A0AAD9LF62_BABDI|nr:tRNA methyl transferase family protein [Babesia divergens]
MKISALSLAVSCLIPACHSLYTSRLHITSFLNARHDIGSPNQWKYNVSNVPSNVEINDVSSCKLSNAFIRHHGTHSFLNSSSIYGNGYRPEKSRPVHVASQHANEQGCDDFNQDEATSTTEATRRAIDRLRNKLSTCQDHATCVEKLAFMGFELYKGAPEPSVLSKPPENLADCRGFYLQSSSGNIKLKRSFFLFKPPVPMEYKLIKGCISSLYVSVYVDKEHLVHVDGTADSLITKSILALILNSIQGLRIDRVMQLHDVDVCDNALVARIGIIKRNGVETILKHIKSEICLQASSKVPYAVKPGMRDGVALKRVAVLVSGGVDSSVALWLLKSRGYDVEAFYLKVWGIEKVDNTGNCEWATDVDYVMRLCRQLDVPLHVIPFHEFYHDRVIDRFVEGTRCGETPNPDVFCNQFIKFGAFLDYAKLWGFSHVASGHYARLVEDIAEVDGCETTCNSQMVKRPIKRLCIALDKEKDQTYFLSRLSQGQLRHVVFPIGTFLKSQVREIARTLNFDNHSRKDSTGLCFLGKVSVRSFLTGLIGREPGPVVDYDTKQQIGEHPGLHNFTIGQREGISRFLSSLSETHKSRHVVKKDHITNTLYVSSSYNSDKYVSVGGIRRCFHVSDIKWNVPDFRRYTQGKALAGLRLKLRHSPNYTRGHIEFQSVENCDRAYIRLFSPDIGIATGQYAVFYVGDECIGSGKMIATAT